METLPQTKEVEDFLKSIGPFYELAEEENTQEGREDNDKHSPSKTPGGPHVSIPAVTNGEENPSNQMSTKARQNSKLTNQISPDVPGDLTNQMYPSDPIKRTTEVNSQPGG